MIDNLKIPHNFEAEQAIIGRVIIDPSELVKIISILKPEDFHDDKHQHIYLAIQSLFTANQPIDEISIGNNLGESGYLEDIGGYGYLAELGDTAPTTGKVEYWAELVKDDSMLRSLIEITSNISRKARDPQQSVTKLLIEAQDKIKEIASRRQSDVRILGDVLLDCFSELEKLSGMDTTEVGIKLGFEDIDNLVTGLMPGDLMVIGARPGMGKSAFGLNVIVNVALAYNAPCLLFSREMQKTKLAKRALSSEGRISQFFLKTGKSGKVEDWDRLARTTDRLQNAQVYLDDKTKQIDEMIFKCHNLHAQHGLKLIVFDYLQKIIGCGQRVREQEIADISAKLKDLAMDLDVPVIALAQLNRLIETRGDKRPQLSDLRESGAIEQDADIIGFIYRDDYYNPDNSEKPGIAEIDLQKVRDGATGMVELRFEGRYTKFSTIPKYAPNYQQSRNTD